MLYTLILIIIKFFIVNMFIDQPTAAAALAYGDVLKDKAEDSRRSDKNGTASQDGAIQMNMWRT